MNKSNDYISIILGVILTALLAAFGYIYLQLGDIKAEQARQGQQIIDMSSTIQSMSHIIENLVSNKR